jgi:sec-independent protein translocase protein TatA
MTHSVLLGVFGMGGPEMTLIVIALLLMFGGKKIPELMKGLGKGIKEFKDASNGVDGDHKSPDGSKTIEKKD